MKTSLGLLYSFFIASCAVSGFGAELAQEYTVTDRGPHDRVWERTEYETTPEGAKLPHVHRHVELATGLNYFENGEWLESKEEIEVFPNGGAGAVHGQHRAYFPSDIYEGSVQLITPDGLTLES